MLAFLVFTSTENPSFMWRGLQRYGGMLLAYSSDVWIKGSLCAKSQSQWLQPWSAPCDRGLTGLTDHALTCRLDAFVALLHLLNLCRSIRNEKEMGMVQRCVSKQLRRDANASHLFVQCSLCWKGITLVCPMWNCTAIVFSLVGPILLHLAI